VSTNNVDARELHKFSDIAGRWWDPEGEFKPLHDLNPLRLDYVASLTPLLGQRVVDVGCGGGLLTEALACRGAEVLGIDMSPESLEVARLHLLESDLKVEYQETTAETLAQRAPGGFDLVSCMELLEHVPDPASVVSACATLVRPGGRVFFSTINRNPKSWLFAVVAAEYFLHLLPRGTHEYRRFIRPSELSRWARGAGLQVVNMTGLHYNPLTRAYWLGDGVDVNYLLCCQKSDPEVA
jgi:2-polyprenyl-6-hydroxyphenyl methylase/3-demethylubiquinone-9 3-methyltransferase